MNGLCIHTSKRGNKTNYPKPDLEQVLLFFNAKMWGKQWSPNREVQNSLKMAHSIGTHKFVDATFGTVLAASACRG
jgi:hypothetical protein